MIPLFIELLGRFMDTFHGQYVVIPGLFLVLIRSSSNTRLVFVPDSLCPTPTHFLMSFL